GRSHFFKSPVRTRNVQVLGGGQTLSRVGTQRRSNQLIAVIHSGGNTMHRADKCARPASHHAESQPPTLALTPGFTRHVSLPFEPAAPAFCGSLLRRHQILRSRQTLALPSR